MKKNKNIRIVILLTAIYPFYMLCSTESNFKRIASIMGIVILILIVKIPFKNELGSQNKK